VCIYIYVCVCVCVGSNLHLSQSNKKVGSLWAISLDTPHGSTPDIDTDSRDTRGRLSTGAVQRLGLRACKVVYRHVSCEDVALLECTMPGLKVMVTGRRKVVHVHGMKACGEMEIQHHIFLASTLDRVVNFTFRQLYHRGESSGPHYRGGWVDLRDGPDVLGRGKILGCVGNQSKSHRMYSKYFRHYTDWATPVISVVYQEETDTSLHLSVSMFICTRGPQHTDSRHGSLVCRCRTGFDTSGGDFDV
jgi:hypothetical protein